MLGSSGSGARRASEMNIFLSRGWFDLHGHNGLMRINASRECPKAPAAPFIDRRAHHFRMQAAIQKQKRLRSARPPGELNTR